MVHFWLDFFQDILKSVFSGFNGYKSQNKIKKLESDVLKPYLKKLPFFVQIVNSI
jgi:hypothetical protein